MTSYAQSIFIYDNIKISLILASPKCGLPFIVKATYLEFCLDCGINESKIKNRPHARDAGTMVSL